MKVTAISENIFCIRVDDHSTRLFEGLWPIEDEGITYNSYLIRDQQTALVDLCKEIFQQDYLNELKALVDPASITYLVVNHMEPDHSGALRAFRRLAPQAVILGTQKAVQMMSDFFGITENVRAITDGEELDLGSHKLRFISAPMVHWPETMLTYETQTQTLFSCDAFGGYGIPEDGIFDEDYSELAYFEDESLRYFVNIVAAFSKPVLNAGKKLEGVPVRTVAPSHGLVWRKHPQHIIDLYMQWSGYSQGPAEKGVTLLHGSMYGNTDKMVAATLGGLKASGVPVMTHDVTTTAASYILPSLWKYQGVVIGAPTYEGGLFPTMALPEEPIREDELAVGRNAGICRSAQRRKPQGSLRDGQAIWGCHSGILILSLKILKRCHFMASFLKPHFHSCVNRYVQP
jgi:anaerobic nitric oxide reductase flavorubredoxin